MNKTNFELEMQKIMANIAGEGQKPKLLLHACCAPCASSVVERLKDGFEVALYFYNPNMDSLVEYEQRAEEIVKLSRFFGINYILEEYNSKDFFSVTKGLEGEKEGGARCESCFGLRLGKTADYARQNAFDFFATTLTVSPLKNAEIMNRIGLELESENGVKYLPSDFKKKNGYIRSIELSKELNMYRQNYCGCVYSKSQKSVL